MKASKTRIPTYLFLCKALLVTTVMIAAGAIFFTRYYIGHDFQAIRCIEAFSTYLVDRMDRDIVRNKVYVFASKDLRPYYEPGTKLTKFLVGMPGDTVEIDQDDNVLINGVIVGSGLALAETHMGKSSEDFRGSRILKENEYWMMGDSKESFDSRYWGSIKREDIIARAYPIF